MATQMVVNAGSGRAGECLNGSACACGKHPTADEARRAAENANLRVFNGQICLEPTAATPARTQKERCVEVLTAHNAKQAAAFPRTDPKEIPLRTWADPRAHDLDEELKLMRRIAADGQSSPSAREMAKLRAEAIERMLAATYAKAPDTYNG